MQHYGILTRDFFLQWFVCPMGNKFIYTTVLDVGTLSLVGVMQLL